MRAYYACTLCRLAISALLLCCAALAGCYGIGVRDVGHATLSDEICSDITEDGRLSPYTADTLHQCELLHRYRHAPAQALTELQVATEQHPAPEKVFALAELCFAQARAAQRWEDSAAQRLYYQSAGYAYHYLFDGPAADPYDPRFRLACDFYNAALEQCLRTAVRAGRFDARCELRLPAPDGMSARVGVVQKGFPCKREEFGQCVFCCDYKVVGLSNRHTNHGLGVPLACMRSPDVPPPAHLIYPHGMSFPATAFLHFDGTLEDLRKPFVVKGIVCPPGQLELYNTVTMPSTEIAGRPVPLESDLTMPLAYFAGHSELDGVEYLAFVHADNLRDRTGIYMFEPYQPGKIPVLMVHGLLSNPLTWCAMFNDLRADPQIREKYQFWFYLYPSGSPWLAVAGDLRQNLIDVRKDLDPGHQDAALDQMVVVGHSMGGLVAKLLTVDSGRDFWTACNKQPFETLKIKPETRSELQRIFYFESQPGIRRVVFIGTPHHGSEVSPSPVGKLAGSVAALPMSLRNAARDALRAESEDSADAKKAAKHLPTSVDLLAPGAPALELLAARRAPEGVHYHSIIGDKPFDDPFMSFLSGPIKEPSDGVVPLRSAQIDGVDSELIVEADHEHIHLDARSIEEVRRILLLHLRELDQIQRVKGSE
jgi:pimeloyl-ACP methyl ester carboxylesterase